MADTRTQDRWLNGFPAIIQYVDTAYDLGSQDRWLNGFPAIIQDEYVASGGVIKTVGGLSLSSAKTINGLAIGSVKTKNGAAAQ